MNSLVVYPCLECCFPFIFLNGALLAEPIVTPLLTKAYHCRWQECSFYHEHFILVLFFLHSPRTELMLVSVGCLSPAVLMMSLWEMWSNILESQIFIFKEKQRQLPHALWCSGTEHLHILYQQLIPPDLQQSASQVARSKCRECLLFSSMSWSTFPLCKILRGILSLRGFPNQLVLKATTY